MKKNYRFGALALGVGAMLTVTAAHAGPISHVFSFDDIASGAPANTTAQPPGLGVSFFAGALLPAYDQFGDVIPGSETWQVDGQGDDIIADNPDLYGRGPAPSPVNALSALFQPVLVWFDVPFNLDANGFGVTLDNDSFGLNGLLPGYPDIAVQFYDENASLLGATPIDQTTPGYSVLDGGYSAVKFVLLPAGAFYDDIAVSGTAVPEPASLAMLIMGGAACLVRRRG